MASGLWRATIIVHRYLGVAVGLLMLVWFASGIVMMYVPYPDLTNRDRLALAAPIAWDKCCAFAARTADDDPIRAVRIQSMAGEPVLFLRPEGRPESLTSLTGRSLDIDDTKARAVALDAAPRIMAQSAPLLTSELIERDQWTVGDAGAGNRPLYRFVFDDPQRTNIYVSSTTGEVVLWTTASQRFWNWIGAVPHWLYFTELRKNGPVWAQIVIYTSLVGGFLTALGLYLGIMQFKRGSSGRISPYRGWFYWHHIAGLVFGVVTLTWVISGMLSMNPWGLLEGGGGEERVRLAGEPPPWSEVRQSIEAIRANPPLGVVRFSSAPFEGKLFWLAAKTDGSIARLDAQGAPAPLSEVEVAQAAKRLAGERPIASAGMMAAEDPYYFDFSIAERSDPPPMPVYRMILNDSEQTRFYFHPNTGQLLRVVDSNARGQRWLFNGLHRFDFAQWLRARPLWDIIVLVLMLGGLAVSTTGVWLALKRIKRDLTFRRAG